MSVVVNIDHSTGDLSQWTSAVTDGGDLSVTAGAALAGTNYGMSCLINDTTAIYGSKTVSITSGIARYRFYFNPNSMSIPSGGQAGIFSLRRSTIVSSIVSYYNNSGTYQIRVALYNDSASPTSVYANLANTSAEHYIEINTTRAATSLSSDGRLDWWIDGTAQTSVTGIDNYDNWGASQDAVRMGAGTGIAITASTSGTWYLDELVVNDDGGEIGPLVSTVTITVAEGNVTTTGDEITYSYISDKTGKGRVDIFSDWRFRRLPGSTRGLFRITQFQCDECPTGMVAWKDWLDLNNPIPVVNITVEEGFVSATQDAITVTFTGGGGVPSVDVAEGFVSTTGDAVTVSTSYALTVSEGFVTSTGDAVTVSTTANITVSEGFVSTTGDAVTVSGGTLTQSVTVAEGFVSTTGDAVTVSYIIPVVSLTVAEGFVTSSGDVVTVSTITRLNVAEGFVATTGDIVTLLILQLLFPGTRRVDYTNSGSSHSTGRRANNYTASPTDYEASVRNKYYVNIRENAEVED